jgi:hypothetical protein
MPSHSPASQASSPEIHRILNRLPLIQLESLWIWTTSQLFLAPDFLEKIFLAMERVILSVDIFLFRTFPSRCTVALATVKRDVWWVPF